MNFKALIFYFFKKFQPHTTRHEDYYNYIFSHSPSLTHHFILCAYFYIILTEAITFPIRKD